MSPYNYDHLKGHAWDFGTEDCLSLVRSFYKDMFGIPIRNYARPNLFWNNDMDLYMRLANKEGFTALHCHPSEYQFGDVVLMAINSKYANHAGVMVENNHLLHHLVNQISGTTPYKGLFRNNTLAVMRHKDVVLKKDESTMSILDTLSPAMRKRVEDGLREAQGTV